MSVVPVQTFNRTSVQYLSLFKVLCVTGVRVLWTRCGTIEENNVPHHLQPAAVAMATVSVRARASQMAGTNPAEGVTCS